MKPRAERRREAREAQKRGPQAPAEKSNTQRRLAGSILLLFFFCVCVSLVVGGRLWISVPGWLAAIGWILIGGVGLLGFWTWKNERKHFKLQGKWLRWLFYIIVLGAIGSYAFTQSIRNIQVSLEVREIRQTHKTLIEATEQWKGTSWAGAECDRVMKTHPALVKQILHSPLPPSSDSFRLLMAVNQVAYMAGCDVDFNSQAKQLLDDDNTWRKAAPWQYNALRAWVNQGGWPRGYGACHWEVSRARIGGKETVAKRMESLCRQQQPDKLSPWNGGLSLAMAEKMVALEEEGNKEREQFLMEREREKNKKD